MESDTGVQRFAPSSPDLSRDHHLDGLTNHPSAQSDSSSAARPRTASIRSSSSQGNHGLEDTARYLFNLIRQRYYNHDDGHLKSSNKLQPNLGSPETARSEAAYSELVQFRSMVQHDSDIVNGTRAHNCGELTGLVAHHCREMGVPCAKLDIAKGHQLAIIGELPSKSLGNDMRRWPSNLCFVDVWAGIHGRANEYPDKFLQKMQGWSDKEKYVSLSSGEWVQATDERWLNLIRNGHKAFFD